MYQGRYEVDGMKAGLECGRRICKTAGLVAQNIFTGRVTSPNEGTNLGTPLLLLTQPQFNMHVSVEKID